MGPFLLKIVRDGWGMSIDIRDHDDISISLNSYRCQFDAASFYAMVFLLVTLGD